MQLVKYLLLFSMSIHSIWKFYKSCQNIILLLNHDLCKTFSADGTKSTSWVLEGLHKRQRLYKVVTQQGT